MGKRPKQYWRKQANAFPSGLDPLPPGLTATQTITNYPNHLEDRDVVASLTNDHGLDCGQIYEMMPDSLTAINNKRLDVSRLSCKAYSARGNQSKKDAERDDLEGVQALDDTSGIQYVLPDDIRAIVAQGHGLGQSIERFTAMARLVRDHARTGGGEDFDEEEDEGVGVRTEFSDGGEDGGISVRTEFSDEVDVGRSSAEGQHPTRT